MLKNCHYLDGSIGLRIAVAVVEQTENMRFQIAPETAPRRSGRQNTCLGGEELWQP